MLSTFIVISLAVVAGGGIAYILRGMMESTDPAPVDTDSELPRWTAHLKTTSVRGGYACRVKLTDETKELKHLSNTTFGKSVDDAEMKALRSLPKVIDRAQERAKVPSKRTVRF